MPFKSQAQRGWMYANHPKMAKRWEKHTSSKKLPKKVSEAFDPTNEASVIQFYHELMKWARANGVSPAEARELRDAYLSMYQVLPDMMPDATPEEFGREYIQNWRENGMEPDGSTSKTFNYAPSHKGYKDLDEAPAPEDGAPPGYEIQQLSSGIWSLTTPNGNVQDHWTTLEKALEYAWWHYDISGEGGTDVARNWRNEEINEMSKTCPSCEEGHHERCRDEWCDCCGTGKATVKEMFGVQTECGQPPDIEVPEEPVKLENVFRIKEAPIQNRPPPGSQVLKPTDYTTMGQKGQALKKGMEAMKNSGQEMTPYKTPDGQQIAFPKDAAPGRGPVKADLNTGTWTPMTGSQMGGSGTPFSSQTPTTTMK